MVRDYQLDLAAAAKRVSQVYASGAADAQPSAADDIPFRQLILSARGGVAFVGAASDVSTTNYGVRAEIGAAGSAPVTLGPFESGPIKLSDFWAAGAGSTLHILGIPY